MKESAPAAVLILVLCLLWPAALAGRRLEAFTITFSATELRHFRPAAADELVEVEEDLNL